MEQSHNHILSCQALSVKSDIARMTWLFNIFGTTFSCRTLSHTTFCRTTLYGTTLSRTTFSRTTLFKWANPGLFSQPTLSRSTFNLKTKSQVPKSLVSRRAPQKKKTIFFSIIDIHRSDTWSFDSKNFGPFFGFFPKLVVSGKKISDTEKSSFEIQMKFPVWPRSEAGPCSLPAFDNLVRGSMSLKIWTCNTQLPAALATPHTWTPKRFRHHSL